MSGRVGFACPTSDRCHAGIVVTSRSPHARKRPSKAPVRQHPLIVTYMKVIMTTLLPPLGQVNIAQIVAWATRDPPAPVVTGCTLFVDLLYVV